MAKYEIYYTTKYKKSIKRYDNKTIQEIEDIIDRLANNEILEAKYKDNKLKGSYKGLRECHKTGFASYLSKTRKSFNFKCY